MFKAKPISIENKQFLRNAQCAFVDGVPYVCCAEQKIGSTQRPPVTKTEKILTSTQPAIVTETTTEEPEEEEEDETPEWLLSLKNKVPAAPECGIQFTDRIFGGEKVYAPELPWTVLVEVKNETNKKFHCGGSIINSRYVVTGIVFKYLSILIFIPKVFFSCSLLRKKSFKLGNFQRKNRRMGPQSRN
jgi:hypothetical protein